MEEHSIHEINDGNFDTEVLEYPGIYIIKLCSGRGCDPEKMDALEDKLAIEYQGEVRFGMLDTEENPFTTNRLFATSEHLYIVFKKGEEIARFSDQLSYDEIKKFIHESFRR
jgi:thioredoxin-like negative regulator of GroEL